MQEELKTAIEEIACFLRKAIPFGDELELSLLDRKRLERMTKDFPTPTRKLVQGLRFN